MKASAPGKIILFGEHAVVYNRPALAVPLNQARVEAEVLDSETPGVQIDAPLIDLHSDLSALPSDHPIARVFFDLFQRFDISAPPNLRVSIKSDLPVAAGLGSGAAVSVALFCALSKFLNRPLSIAQLNQMVFEIEKLHHGSPSGIDNAVVVYNMPIYFIKDKPIETFACAKPFTIVVADSGISAPTKQAVGDVRRLWLRDPNRFEALFDEIAQISTMARHFIETGRPAALGELMNQNHELLRQITVSSPELDALVNAALKAGALGAKLSGGGRGGNIIALTNQTQAQTLAESLIAAGAKRAIIAEIR